MEKNNFNSTLNNKSQKSSRFLSRIKTKTWIKILTTNIATFFVVWQGVNHFSNEIDSDFEQLKFKIKDITTSYETLYHSCIKK